MGATPATLLSFGPASPVLATLTWIGHRVIAGVYLFVLISVTQGGKAMGFNDVSPWILAGLAAIPACVAIIWEFLPLLYFSRKVGWRIAFAGYFAARVTVLFFALSVLSIIGVIIFAICYENRPKKVLVYR